MFGMYKRKMRGGDKLDDIQMHITAIQDAINEIKNNSIQEKSSIDEESSMVEEPSLVESRMDESITEKSEPISKDWVDDKTIKFKDGSGGRTTLSFNRILSLLDILIKKGDTKKDWTIIKQKLNNANSIDEVQKVIDEYKIKFASNYVAGTRRKKRHGKKKTHRRR